MRPRILLSLAALTVTALPISGQSRDASTFSFYFENDALQNSDTGYSNGVRIAWSALRYRGWMRQVTQFNLATAFDAVLGATIIARPLQLHRIGLIPDTVPGKHCDENPARDDRQFGPCTMLNVALAQMIYTPDSLASTNRVLNDQPYAGFLYGTLGVTMLDAPRMRHPGHWIAFTQVSHQLLFGFTGKWSFSENTQSLAHWTFSPASHRPLGWRNQLRTAPQAGLITDIAARPWFFEFCKDGCDGTIDERRLIDLTPHTEAVASTHMLRLSQGLTLRAGYDFPDMVDALRIPVTAPPGSPEKRGLVILGDRYWLYGFLNVEARYVPYNMFLAGGWRDWGPYGWRDVRQIMPRHGVIENAVGGAIGSSSMSLKGQFAFRSREYDVMGAP
jgi:hypothetical protein